MNSLSLPLDVIVKILLPDCNRFAVSNILSNHPSDIHFDTLVNLSGAVTYFSAHTLYPYYCEHTSRNELTLYAITLVCCTKS